MPPKEEGPPPTPLRSVCWAISYLLHPAVVMLATAAGLSARGRDRALMVALDVAVLAGALAPPLAVIHRGVRRGRIGHDLLLERRERLALFPLALACFAAALLAYRALGAPRPLTGALALAVVGGIGTAVISRRFKISLHAAVAAGCAVLLAPGAPAPTVLAAAGLAAVAGLARLPLGHHSAAEVAAGWAYGAASAAALVALLGR